MEMKPALSLSDLIKLCEDDVIYRYMSAEELRGLLRGELRMTCPFQWVSAKEGDSWENLLFQTTIVGKNGRRISARSEGRKVYAHCWTTLAESDAMWRLYTPRNGFGVMVRMKAGALLQSLQERFDPTKNEQIIFKIGRVEYLPNEDLDSRFGSLVQFREGLRGLHEATLAKRDAFKHEQEVRLVAYDFDDRNRHPTLGSENLFKPCATPGQHKRRLHLCVRIDAQQMCGRIEEVVISPRLSPENVGPLMREIVSCGVKPEKVRQSSLYGPREIRVLKLDV